MNYKGKLYGRAADTSGATGKTAEDWNALEERAKRLELEVRILMLWPLGAGVCMIIYLLSLL